MKSYRSILVGIAILVVVSLVGILPVSTALADSATKLPTTGINDATIGTSAWANPGNIIDDVGDNYASAILNKNNRTSNYLRATGFGFTIPAEATINGIEVAIRRMVSTTTPPPVLDNVVTLLKGTTQIVLNQASGTHWPSSFEVATYGGPIDLWGTTWTATEIGTIGVDLSITTGNNNSTKTAYVDYIKVTVYYSIVSTTTMVDCGASTVVYGNSINCIATVTGTVDGQTPTGSVSWNTSASGTFATSPCSLTQVSAGIASCAVDYAPSVVGSLPHTITATYGGDSYYGTSSNTDDVTVSKAAATITITPYNVTYDGNPHAATGTATGVNALDLSSLLDLSGTTHTLVGDYPDDAWTFAGNELYNSANGTTHDQISKASAIITVTPYDVTYDGNPHTATGSATGVKGENLTSLLDLSATTHTDAGDYTSDGWTFAGNANYSSTSGTVHDVIAKANATISLTAYDVTYDGNPHTATGTAAGVNAENLTSLLDLSGTTHTNAGNYSADAWLFTGNVNYNSTSGTISDKIDKANAILVITPYDVIYNGNPRSAAGTATGVKGEDLAGLLDLSATTHTNAGDYPSDAWSFAGDTNYNSANGTVHDQIAKASANISVTPYEVTYDGNAHTATGTATGVKSEDLASLLTLSGTTHTNAGDYPADAWSFAGNLNYNSANGTVHDVIHKAAPVCAVVPYNVKYDGNPHTATGTCLGVKGETLTGLVLTGTTHTSVGNYNDPWTFTDITGNYNNASGTILDIISKIKVYIPFLTH